MKLFLFGLGIFFAQATFAQDFNILAIGDTGKGNEGQYKVGETLADECAYLDCKFVLLLGDNFYDVGVTSPTDPQFVEKFEKPYANVEVPFMVALGNHDYGKLANDWKRGDHQIAYSKTNPKFFIPSHYYTIVKNDALFIVLDTSRLFHNKDTKKQVEFVQNAIKNNKKKWVIVVSHHPYISNGEHGNAGSYDGVKIPPWSGSEIKKLIEKELCAHADLIISGHEHSLQTMPGPKACPKPLFVVSGGGASPADNLRDRNPTFYQNATLGFTSLKFRANEIEVNQINGDGFVEHTQVIRK